MDHRTERAPLPDGTTLLVRHWSPDHPTAVPVLCVHGLASNSLMWAGVAEALAGEGHPVAAVDLRGHGHSDKPDHGYTVPEVAGDLVAVLEHLGWDRAVLAGQSWGGNVVVEASVRHGDRVHAAVAVDGGFIALAERFPEWDECAAALAPPHLIGTPASRLEASMRAAHPDWSDGAIAAAMANFEVVSDGTVAPWLTRERHMTVLHGLWSHDPHRAFEVAEVPVLLVVADSGPAPWVADKRQAVERALGHLGRHGAAHWVSGDHDLHAQHPELVAELIRQWSSR